MISEFWLGVATGAAGAAVLAFINFRKLEKLLTMEVAAANQRAIEINQELEVQETIAKKLADLRGRSINEIHGLHALLQWLEQNCGEVRPRGRLHAQFSEQWEHLKQIRRNNNVAEIYRTKES